MLVDVAINYYGKPYHTLVTIGSLLEHSGSHIGKIFVIKEPIQPSGGEAITDLLARQGWNVEIFTPRFHLGWRAPRSHPLLDWGRTLAMRSRSFRWSIRYQYAFEHTDKRYLFLTHNDMLFQSDVLQPMLSRIVTGDHVAVGDIGACWKCPAKAASICSENRPNELALTHAEAVDLYERFPSPHRSPNVSNLDPVNPVPFPECRLNEWLALIDTGKYLREVKPSGNTEPIGSAALGDTGLAWFKSMMHKGYTFGHVTGDYRHPWTTNRGGGGHEANFDRSLYDHEEAVAEQYYLEHYANK